MLKSYKQVIKQKPVLGLDITSRSIKIAELRLRGKTLNLLNIGEIDLPLSAHIGGVIRQPEEVAKKIKELRQGFKNRKTKNAICSIPDDKVFLQTITMPSLPLNKLKQAIEYKLPSLLPIQPADAYWDWAIVKENKQSKELTILIAASEKLTIDSYLETCRLAEINPVILEPSQISALRVIKGPDLKTAPENLFLLNIEGSLTKASLVANGIIQYTSTYHFGLNQIEKLFGEKYNLRGQAEWEANSAIYIQ